MEKCFLEETLENHPEIKKFSMFRGERLSFQIGLYNTERENPRTPRTTVSVSGEIAEYVKIREVISVPIQYPTSYVGFDTDMLREKPCLCPDPIRPLHYKGAVCLPPELTVCLWIDVVLPDDSGAGTYPVTFRLNDTADKEETTVEIKLCDCTLGEQKLIHTEWFYTDCIAEAYHTKAFSKRHFELIENYMKTAVENGINMILTPVFTPELDTYIGGERMTTQLVGINVASKDKYEFDFTLLDKWVETAKSCGVKYYEIPHFFTQWGAKHAPKFVATVNGRKKKIFGWETDALGEEYGLFLGQFIPALLERLKSHGIDKNCYFHVSDEPGLEFLPQYKKCREILDQYLDGYYIIDALSDFDFYKTGAISKPVPSIHGIKPFIEAKVPDLWAYYCGNSPVQTGRMHTMPQYRTRILGVQLWKENIKGFLHWGYNFYHNNGSHEYVDPLAETGGEYFAPSGDAFLVYPSHDGEALESIRLNGMREAVDDMRALELLEAKKGRETAEKVLRESAGMEITFWDYPRDNGFFAKLKENIIAELEG